MPNFYFFFLLLVLTAAHLTDVGRCKQFYVPKHVLQTNEIWPSPYNEPDTHPQHMGSQQPLTMHYHRSLQRSYSLAAIQLHNALIPQTAI